MTAVRADVAAMLQAGATFEQIKQQLHVSSRTIAHVRDALRIPVPEDRQKRSRAELAVLEDQAVVMLRAGATYAEIYSELRLQPNRVAQLRKHHNIPVPDRDPGATQRRTIDEAFTLHTQPSDGGHLLWTGPRRGRTAELAASGRRHNARAIAFQRHHGREPEGRLRRTPDCDQPDCIAGAHHTDHRIRASHTRADKAYTAIFGQDS